MTDRPPASMLAGVRYGTVDRLADERGSFRELWRATSMDRITPEDAGAAPG